MPDLFHDGRKTIPKSDPKVDRIEFDKEEIGARKSHLKGIKFKNDHVISHVSKG